MEANIIYRISQGDEHAFDTLMDVCSPSLYRYALGIVCSREVAEEIVSDVFMEVWKMRGSLLEISSLESWMRKVTYCKAVTALRHDYSCPEGVSIDDIVNFNIDTAPSPDEEIISREDASLLNQAIQSLPEKMPTCVLSGQDRLHAIQGDCIDAWYYSGYCQLSCRLCDGCSSSCAPA